MVLAVAVVGMLLAAVVKAVAMAQTAQKVPEVVALVKVLPRASLVQMMESFTLVVVEVEHTFQHNLLCMHQAAMVVVALVLGQATQVLIRLLVMEVPTLVEVVVVEPVEVAQTCLAVLAVAESCVSVKP